METTNKNPVWMNRVTNFSPLKGIGEKMIEQDNLATSYPLFEVKDNQKLYGVNPESHEYAKRVYIVEGIEVDVDEIFKDFDNPSCSLFESKEHFEDFKQFIDLERQGSAFLLKNGDIVQIDHYINIPTTVTTFFTNEAAKDYITRNSHKLNDPFVFVSSAYDNPEMKAVMEFMATSKEFKRIVDEETNENTFDFEDGNGAVLAHQHKFGGGWVADTATVADTAYVGPDARVYGDAQVINNVYIGDKARVFGCSQIYGNAQVFGNANVYGNAKIFYRAGVFGNAQIFENACVHDNALVNGDVKLSGHAEICGDSAVFDNAQVYGNAMISDNSWVYGNTEVYGSAKISGDAQIFDNASVYDDAVVFNNAHVFGSAQVYGSAMIFDEAQVSGNAVIYEKTSVYGKAQVSGDAIICGEASVYGKAQISGDARIGDNMQISGDTVVIDSPKTKTKKPKP